MPAGATTPVVASFSATAAAAALTPSPAIPSTSGPDLPRPFNPRRRQGAVTALLSRALGKVGLSIFVTSLSDVLAFVVGSTFIMPATSSLCVWLGIGICFVFILMNTFFVACLSLIERYRLPRWEQELEKAEETAASCSIWNYIPSVSRSRCPKKRRARNLDSFAHLFKKYYVPLTVTKWFTLVSCVSTFGVLAACIYGAAQVRIVSLVRLFIYSFIRSLIQYFIH